MARVYVLSGPDLGKSFEVTSGSVLGRASDCDVPLRDASISRQHARVEWTKGSWSVVDLGSRNGLLVGGAKVAQAPLADGSEFALGEVQLRFRAQAAVEAAPIAAPLVPAPMARPVVEDGEIVLEGEWEEPPPRASAPVAPRSVPPPSAPPRATPPAAPIAPPRASVPVAPVRAPSPSAVARAAALGGVERKDRGVLQYSKVEVDGGFFRSDLGQQPWYVKLGVWTLALALFAAVLWGAFHATSFFKAKVAGPVEEQDDAEPR